MPSAYRAAEKRWRQSDGREPELLDFERADSDDRMHRVAVDDSSAPDWLRGAEVYGVRGVDGLRFVRSPFSPADELRWSKAALCQWAEPPNESNLLVHSAAPIGDFFRSWVASPSTSELNKLSWVTLGYHYQWTQRRYVARKRSPFPAELASLASDLAQAAGFSLRAEAAIVNYYAAKATMGVLDAPARSPHGRAPVA